MNSKKINIDANFKKNKLVLFLPSIFLLFFICFYLIFENKFTADSYISIQKELFFYLNRKLSVFPLLQFNLTNIGDALIFLSLLSVFIIYIPRLWAAIITALIMAVSITYPLKKLFSVPRPATSFNPDSFVVIGKTLQGNTSLPSGHSVVAFTIITILLFVFMPKKPVFKIFWTIAILIIGLLLVFSRVAVGAHYPLDVVVGSAIGYIIGLLGINLSLKLSQWNWINNKKYYPIYIGVFVICSVVIIKKIIDNNLLVFYLAMLSLLSTIYLMIKIYVKKQ